MKRITSSLLFQGSPEETSLKQAENKHLNVKEMTLVGLQDFENRELSSLQAWMGENA